MHTHARKLYTYTHARTHSYWLSVDIRGDQRRGEVTPVLIHFHPLLFVPEADPYNDRITGAGGFVEIGGRGVEEMLLFFRQLVGAVDERLGVGMPLAGELHPLVCLAEVSLIRLP